MTGPEQHQLEAASKAAMGLGSSTAVVSGLTVNHIGVIVGIIVGVTGLAFQVWLGLERRAREKEAHRKLMTGK